MAVTIDKLKKMRRIGLMDGAYFDHRAVTTVLEQIAVCMTDEEKCELYAAIDNVHKVVGKKQFRLLSDLDNAGTVDRIEPIVWR